MNKQRNHRRRACRTHRASRPHTGHGRPPGPAGTPICIPPRAEPQPVTGQPPNLPRHPLSASNAGGWSRGSVTLAVPPQPGRVRMNLGTSGSSLTTQPDHRSAGGGVLQATKTGAEAQCDDRQAVRCCQHRQDLPSPQMRPSSVCVAPSWVRNRIAVAQRSPSLLWIAPHPADLSTPVSVLGDPSILFPAQG